MLTLSCNDVEAFKPRYLLAYESSRMAVYSTWCYHVSSMFFCKGFWQTESMMRLRCTKGNVFVFLIVEKSTRTNNTSGIMVVPWKARPCRGVWGHPFSENFGILSLRNLDFQHSEAKSAGFNVSFHVSARWCNSLWRIFFLHFFFA